MQSFFTIAALFAAVLGAPAPTDCPDVGSRGFFPFAFKAINDVTGKEASASFYFDDHSREFRQEFAGTGLDQNGVIKATRLQSLTYFELDNHQCSVYDPNNDANVGTFDKTLGWGDIEINGGQETDVTSFTIRCDTLIIWYPNN